MHILWEWRRSKRSAPRCATFASNHVKSNGTSHKKPTLQNHLKTNDSETKNTKNVNANDKRQESKSSMESIDAERNCKVGWGRADKRKTGSDVVRRHPWFSCLREGERSGPGRENSQQARAGKQRS